MQVWVVEHEHKCVHILVLFQALKGMLGSVICGIPEEYQLPALLFNQGTTIPVFKEMSRAAFQLYVCAGRREQTSLSIYVAFDGPLDQHFMRYPSKLFGATVETPQVDPNNLILLQQHVVCAAVELPVVPSLDRHFFGPVRS